MEEAQNSWKKFVTKVIFLMRIVCVWWLFVFQVTNLSFFIVTYKLNSFLTLVSCSHLSPFDDRVPSVWIVVSLKIVCFPRLMRLQGRSVW